MKEINITDEVSEGERLHEEEWNHALAEVKDDHNRAPQSFPARLRALSVLHVGAERAKLRELEDAGKKIEEPPRMSYSRDHRPQYVYV